MEQDCQSNPLNADMERSVRPVCAVLSRSQTADQIFGGEHAITDSQALLECLFCRELAVCMLVLLVSALGAAGSCRATT